MYARCSSHFARVLRIIFLFFVVLFPRTMFAQYFTVQASTVVCRFIVLSAAFSKTFRTKIETESDICIFYVPAREGPEGGLVLKVFSHIQQDFCFLNLRNAMRSSASPLRREECVLGKANR